MKNAFDFISKSFIIFIVVFMANSAIVYAENEYEIAFTTDKIDKHNIGATDIALSFSLKYDPGCEQLEAELLLPAGSIDASNASVNDLISSDLNVKFNKIGEDVPERPGYKKYKITFSPAVDNQSTVFTIGGFRSLRVVDPCDIKKEYDILYVRFVPKGCSTNINIIENSCTLELQPPAIYNASVGAYLGTVDNCDEKKHPFRFLLEIYHSRGSYDSHLVSVRIRKDQRFNCIGIAEDNLFRHYTKNVGYYYHYYNVNNFSLEDKNINDDEYIYFDVQNILNNTKYYMLYFTSDPALQGLQTMNLEVELVYKEREGCSALFPDYETKTLKNLYNFSFNPNCNYNDNLPDLQYTASPIAPEIIDCEPISNKYSSMQVQVDNSFIKGYNQQFDSSTPLFYDLELKPNSDIIIKNISFMNNSYPLEGKISYRIIKYGENEWESDFNLVNPNSIITVESKRPQKIQVKFEGDILNSYFSQDFKYEYTTEKFQDEEPSYNGVSISLHQNNTILKERKFDLIVKPTSTQESVGTFYAYFFDKTYKYIFSSPGLSFDSDYYVMVKVETQDISKIPFDDFTLDKRLQYVESEGIKWYYGSLDQYNGSFQENLFDVFPHEDNCIVENNVFKFKNLKELGLIPNICENPTEKAFYLLFKVKLYPEAPSTNGTYGTLAELPSNISFGKSYARFYVSGNAGFLTYSYVSCDESQNTLKSQMAKDDKYFYKCVVENTGRHELKDVFLIGSLPYVGDKRLADSEPRNSQFDIPLSSVESIKIFYLDKYNNPTLISSGTLASLNNNWSIDFTSVQNPCFNNDLTITPKEGCQPPYWNKTSQNALFFRIKSPQGNNIIMSAYDKILVQLEGKLPSSISENMEARASFIANVTPVNLDPLFAKEVTSLPTIVVVPQSSCYVAPDCEQCLASFAPFPNEKYVLSAWVREAGGGVTGTTSTYEHSYIKISFTGSDETFDCRPEGSIIDGWQRIQTAFQIPKNAVKINIELKNEGGNTDSYFDDIRMFPFNGNMKSYVYDPITMRLVSELDDENYATFYEYDEEGALIRVKKETERGIMTIREARQAKHKNK